MNECITETTCHFTPAASLAAWGVVLEQRKVFEPIRAHVHIEQKTVQHTPLDKLYDSFITPLAGAHGLVEINTLLRADHALQRAFGRKCCAEQSVVQQTLDACTPTQVAQMEQAMEEIYRTHSRGFRHDYRADWQILDVDLCGWLCGKQAAFATKGYFANAARNRRGRQLGRVLAWRYQEVIVDRLFPGNCQLNATLQTLVSAAQNTLQLDAEQRQRTLVRIAEYFRLLCNQFVIALGKTPTEFRQYQSSVRDIEKARKKASGVLDSMQKDERYAWLRGLTVEAIMATVRSSVPGSSAILDQASVKSAANEIAKITQEQLVQVHTKLHDKLGNTLSEYLEASLRLGLALGRDLHEFAKNYPLLIFFDTYEEIDEGDQLLRTVMGAAGSRVGWVIAGRDNLWGGTGQLERNVALEYGYQVCEQVAFDPPLPEVTEEEARHILEVTQGVPLAVKIAAGMYVATADMKIVTEKVESKRKIVDQMVRRYLLHTRAEPSELAHLYGLALLRRADQPATIAVALGLTPTSYASELSRLHRRYSFIFTEKEHPSLHQEVRYFLRRWLLEHRTQPEIVAVNEQLLKAHQDILKKLEDRKQYRSLKERLEDEEWVRVYADLTDQTFWLDPFEGVEYGLPLMIAAIIYRRGANREIVRIGKFFEAVIPQPYRKHWVWAAQSLISRTSRDPSHEEFHGLEELVRLASEKCPRFPPMLLSIDYQKSLRQRFGGDLEKPIRERTRMKLSNGMKKRSHS